jgi:hypothetical protein
VSDAGLLSELFVQSPNVAYTNRPRARALAVLSTGFASTKDRDALPIAEFMGWTEPNGDPRFDVLVLSMRDGPFDMEAMTEARIELIREHAAGRPVVAGGNSAGSAMTAVAGAKGHARGAFRVVSSVHISGVVPDSRGNAKALELALRAAVAELPERTLSELATDAAKAEQVYFEVSNHGHLASISSTARFVLSRFRGSNVNFRGISEDAVHLTRYFREDMPNALSAISFCSGRNVTQSLACLNRHGVPYLVLRGSKDLISTRAAWNCQRLAGHNQNLITALEMGASSHDLFRDHGWRMRLLWDTYGKHIANTLDLIATGRDLSLGEIATLETQFRLDIQHLQHHPHLARARMDAAGIKGYPPKFGPDASDERGMWNTVRDVATGLAGRITGRGDGGMGMEPVLAGGNG